MLSDLRIAQGLEPFSPSALHQQDQGGEGTETIREMWEMSSDHRWKTNGMLGANKEGVRIPKRKLLRGQMPDE